MRLSRLRGLGVAACCLQLMVAVGVPLFQFFLVFGSDMGSMHVLIVTGASATLAGCLGLAAALAPGPLMSALHVVAATALAALMGNFNTQTFLDIRLRCDLAQSAAAGCGACACAQTGSCTAAQLATAPGCDSCRALGTDFCTVAQRQVLLLPYTGVIEAVVLALPAVISLLLLLRLAGAGGPDGGKEGLEKVAVTAWVDERPSEQEDWPMTSVPRGDDPPAQVLGSFADPPQQPSRSSSRQKVSRSSSKQLIAAAEQWPDGLGQPSLYDTMTSGLIAAGQPGSDFYSSLQHGGHNGGAGVGGAGEVPYVYPEGAGPGGPGGEGDGGQAARLLAAGQHQRKKKKQAASLYV